MLTNKAPTTIAHVIERLTIDDLDVRVISYALWNVSPLLLRCTFSRCGSAAVATWRWRTFHLRDHGNCHPFPSHCAAFDIIGRRTFETTTRSRSVFHVWKRLHNFSQSRVRASVIDAHRQDPDGLWNVTSVDATVYWLGSWHFTQLSLPLLPGTNHSASINVTVLGHPAIVFYGRQHNRSQTSIAAVTRGLAVCLVSLLQSQRAPGANRRTKQQSFDTIRNSLRRFILTASPSNGVASVRDAPRASDRCDREMNAPAMRTVRCRPPPYVYRTSCSI